MPSNSLNENVAKLMHGEIMGILQSKVSSVSDEDVFCSVVRMGYGKGGKNPVTGSRMKIVSILI